jgi:hypothetical protein
MIKNQVNTFLINLELDNKIGILVYFCKVCQFI